MVVLGRFADFSVHYSRSMVFGCSSLTAAASGYCLNLQLVGCRLAAVDRWIFEVLLVQLAEFWLHLFVKLVGAVQHVVEFVIHVCATDGLEHHCRVGALVQFSRDQPSGRPFSKEALKYPDWMGSLSPSMAFH